MNTEKKNKTPNKHNIKQQRSLQKKTHRIYVKTWKITTIQRTQMYTYIYIITRRHDLHEKAKHTKSKPNHNQTHNNKKHNKHNIEHHSKIYNGIRRHPGNQKTTKKRQYT